MGREGGGRLCFCEKWLNLATGVSSWGEAFSEYRDRPPDNGQLQVLHLCAVDCWSGTILPWPGEKRQFEHFCKSDNCPASSLSLSNFRSFLYCLFYFVISVLDKESRDLKVLA